MRTNTQQSNPENPLIRKIGVLIIAAALALALAFTFNACSSDDSDDNGSLEDLLANNPRYQREKKELEYYDPDNSEERCTAAGIVEHKCGDEWYNPLKQGCGGNNGVYEVGTIEACGGEVYTKYPSETHYKCENNVLLRECGKARYYNIQTRQCEREGYDSSTGEYSYSIVPLDPKNLCNGVRFTYSEGSRECKDGVVKRSCGNLWYNRDGIIDPEYCDHNDDVKPLPKCGGMYMDGYDLADGYERCATDGKTLEHTCGFLNKEGPWYNAITQACIEADNEGGGYTYILRDKIKCSK